MTSDEHTIKHYL